MQPSPRPGSGASSVQPSPRPHLGGLPAATIAAHRSSSEALTDLYAAAIDDAVAASHQQSAELNREVAATRLVSRELIQGLSVSMRCRPLPWLP